MISFVQSTQNVTITVRSCMFIWVLHLRKDSTDCSDNYEGVFKIFRIES